MFKQRGMTFVGVIILVMVVVFFVYTGFRTLPAYIEYWQLQHVIEDTLHPLDGAPLSSRIIHERFVKNLNLNNITTVKQSDLQVEPTGNGNYHVIVDYSVKEHFWGAISLCMDFKAEGDSR